MIKSLLNRIRLRWLLRGEYEGTAIRAYFARQHRVHVGLYSYGCFDRWRIAGPVTIGRYCSFAKTVRILDANHPMDSLTTHPYLYEAKWGVIAHDRIDARMLEIGDDVWVGHNAVITPGCRCIGRGAIIGAGAIVTRDVPAYAVVAGAPARHIRDRFDAETIAALENSRWWDMDKAALAALVARNPELAFRPNAERLASLSSAG